MTLEVYPAYVLARFPGFGALIPQVRRSLIAGGLWRALRK